MVVFSVRNILRLHIYELILNERLLDLFSFTRGRVGWISKIANFISESVFKQCTPKEFALPTHGCFYALRAYLLDKKKLSYTRCPNLNKGILCHTHSYIDKKGISRCYSCRYTRRIMPFNDKILMKDEVSLCHLSTMENDSDGMKPMSQIKRPVSKNERTLQSAYRTDTNFVPVKFTIKNSMFKDFSFFVDIPIPMSIWDRLFETNQIPHPAHITRNMFQWRKNPCLYNYQTIDVGISPKDQITNVSAFYLETLNQIVEVISDRTVFTNSFLKQDGLLECPQEPWKYNPITPNASNFFILKAISKLSCEKEITSYFAHAELPTCIQRRVEKMFRTPRRIFTETNSIKKSKKFRLKVKREEDVRKQYIMTERERIDRHKRYLRKIFLQTEKIREEEKLVNVEKRTPKVDIIALKEYLVRLFQSEDEPITTPKGEKLTSLMDIKMYKYELGSRIKRLIAREEEEAG